MKHLTKPNRWSCILAAFAMALDESIEGLARFIGHDGSKIAFPDLPDPMCRQGFHVQELVHASLLLHKTVTPFELFPVTKATLGDGAFVITHRARKVMFQKLIDNFRGVITGMGRACSHAVAFDRGRVYDPDPGTIPFSFSFDACEARGFIAKCVWLVQPWSPDVA